MFKPNFLHTNPTRQQQNHHQNHQHNTSNPIMRNRLPPRLYRTQHADSFTKFDGRNFSARGFYFMDDRHWLHATNIIKHVNRRNRSSPPTPFISLTEDKGYAENRARSHANSGTSDVFVATIDTRGFKPSVRTIEFPNMTVDLPVWTRGGIDIFSMRDAAVCFNIDSRVVQESEWLVIEELPFSFLTQIKHF